MTDLEKIPGLDESERDAVSEYEEAKRRCAAVAVGEVFFDSEQEVEETVALLEES
jgi:hypothetical protein